MNLRGEMLRALPLALELMESARWFDDMVAELDREYAGHRGAALLGRHRQRRHL